MIIANKSISKGTKEIVKLKVTRLTNGNDLSITAYIIAGEKEGSTIGLIGGIHGDEIHCFGFFNKLVNVIQPKDLKGNIIIVPVANPLAFEYLTRNTPIDNLDLNRNFPGSKDGWLTEKMAYVITEELVKKMDYLIDFHTSPPNIIVEYSIINKNSKNREMSLLLAKAFEFKYIYNSFGYRGALTTVATDLGVISIATESGPINGDDEEYSNGMVNKIKNALSIVGVIEQKPKFKQDFLIFEEDAYGNIRSPAGGILIPGNKDVYVGKEVEKDIVLFRVYDPYTFDLISEVKPIFERSAIFLYRKRSMVRPGDYAYMICDLNKTKKV